MIEICRCGLQLLKELAEGGQIREDEDGWLVLGEHRFTWDVLDHLPNEFGFCVVDGKITDAGRRVLAGEFRVIGECEL